MHSYTYLYLHLDLDRGICWICTAGRLVEMMIKVLKLRIASDWTGWEVVRDGRWQGESPIDCVWQTNATAGRLRRHRKRLLGAYRDRCYLHQHRKNGQQSAADRDGLFAIRDSLSSIWLNIQFVQAFVEWPDPGCHVFVYWKLPPIRWRLNKSHCLPAPLGCMDA